MKIFDPLNIEVLPYPSENILLDEAECRKTHTSFEQESFFFSRISEGDIEWFRRSVKNGFTDFSFVLGCLSRSELRQAQYSAVSFITLAIRAAISGGMDEEAAYTLSDDFIQRVDRSADPGDIIHFSLSALEKLITIIHNLKKADTEPKAILICRRFISRNLHEKITLRMLSQQCGLSPVYLSSLFKNKTGMTISAFITKERIEKAKKLINAGKYSFSEIAGHAGFCSQSHFIASFKKETGITPNRFIK